MIFLRDTNEVIGETMKIEMEGCLSFVIYRPVLGGFSALGDYAISWLFSRDQATAGAPLNSSQVDPQSFLKQEQDDDDICFTSIIKAVCSDLVFSLSSTRDRSLFFTFCPHTGVVDSACSLAYSTKYQQLINCLREKSSP